MTQPIMIRPRLGRRHLLVLGSGLVAPLLFDRYRFTQAWSLPTPLILVSTPIFADITRQIVGDAAEVQSIIPDGADPHTYEATPRDLVAVTEAVAFIEMGAHLEPFVEAGAWRRTVQEAGIGHLVLAERLPLIERDLVIDHGDHVHDLRAGDPHVWLDPTLVLMIVDAIAAFSEENLPDVNGIALRAAAYRQQVEALDAELEQGLAVVPPEHRKLVVFHDAFLYFAERYDFTVVGAVLPNLEGEASAQHLAGLVETIRAEGVVAIFTEPQFDRRLVDQVAAEAGVAVGELLTDTFAGRVSSYLELMQFNLKSLVTHLAVPPSNADISHRAVRQGKHLEYLAGDRLRY